MDRTGLLDEFFQISQASFRAWKNSYRQVLGGEELTMAQAGVLHLLKERGRLNGRELAMELGISRSAVAQMADDMVRVGYVSREPDQADRRLVYLSLTAQGTDMVDRIQSRRREFFVSIAGTLSDQELQKMTELQGKLLQAIRQYDDSRTEVPNDR